MFLHYFPYQLSSTVPLIKKAMSSTKPQKTMSTSKDHQHSLKEQKPMIDNPPFCGLSSFLTKTDETVSSHEVSVFGDNMYSDMLYEKSFAVYVYSSKPYDEFYESMVEMVMFKLDNDLTIDWDYMEELLLSYLELNEKKVNKYILQAFFDLMEVLDVELSIKWGTRPGKL